MSTGENDLIKKSVKGDFQAFEELIQPYQQKVYNLCYRMLGNDYDAVDSSQEVFLKVYGALGKFRKESSFSTWLYRITMNTCADQLRKRKKQKNIVSLEQMEDIGIGIAETDSRGNSPEFELNRRESRDEIISAINKLSYKFKAAVVLKDLHGFTYSEIADIQKCSIGTVKSRLSRGRNYLRDILEKDMEQKENRFRQNSRKEG
ncbi:MAG: sigma-70 family RNA polymerase sigma factor [Clostridia bacterium]|nr:sigma-70 family RNA polymerase sigma factor [Clostridia bacterium]